MARVSASASKLGARLLPEARASSGAAGTEWTQSALVRARLIGLVLLALLLVFALARPIGPAGSPEASVSAVLAERGLSVEPGSIAWLRGPQGPLALRPLLVIASRADERADVYYLEARIGGSGRVLDLHFLRNVTRTSSAEESGLVSVGPFFAFGVRVGDRVEAVTVLDARGEPEALTADWPLRARVQNAITNFQEQGRVRGFGRVRYGLDPAPAKLDLYARGHDFLVHADGVQIVIDPYRVKARVSGEQAVHPELAHKGEPGTITWVVDTVRNLPFVGAAPIEWLEHTVFNLTDRAERLYHRVAGGDSDEAASAALAASEVVAEPPAELVPEPPPGLPETPAPKPEWPPADLSPALPDPLRGEGKWLPIVDEMVASYEGAPPAFYQTFLRVDPEREYTRVFVTLWDPKLVQLHIAMGTQEPISATGETGSGIVPREERTLKRLVGGFNGGFQALHGEFGMMAEGRVYLPPKPYAATVAVFEDGRVGMGSWPGAGRSGWDEASANAQIPPDMIAMRQNLTSVVEGDRYNPWKRWWWGAAPEFANEQTYIHRSGLCLTDAGHLAYFWGESMGPDELGRAMLTVRCVRGLHLDMNSKHTGLELYRTYENSTPPEPMARKLDPETEHEGPIEGTRWSARARLAVKTMTPLRFPRYISRDPRDFFFLTLRPVLPGPALRASDPTNQAVAFSAAGLPHSGYPAAFARAEIADDRGKLLLLRIDPARARVVTHGLEAEPVLRLPPPSVAGLEALDSSSKAELLALFERRVAGLLRLELAAAREGAPVLSAAPAFDRGKDTRALGIDREGFLLYAELLEGSPALLAEALELAGVDDAMSLATTGRASVLTETGQRTLDGGEPPASHLPNGLAFALEQRPAADVMFPEVEPKPYRFWGYQQGQRVRYFPQHPPRFRAPEDVLTGAADAGAR